MLDFIILLSLQSKERYGYEMIKEIKLVSGLEISEGTVYPLLNRLKKEALITSRWVEMETGIPRKYYQLSKQGQAMLARMKVSWSELIAALQRLMEENP